MSVAAVPRGGVHRLPLAFVGGIGGIVAYLVCTFAAYLLYPGSFGPLDNWLSDLGSANLNPTGALLYNAGVVLTGIALAAFFFGQREWGRIASPSVRRRMTAVQIIGYTAAATTVATGLVSESVDADLHGVLSMTQIETLGSALALTGLFLYRQRGFWRPIAWLALATEIAALAFGFVVHTFPMEWIAISLVLADVGLMALNTWSASGSGARPRPARLAW